MGRGYNLLFILVTFLVLVAAVTAQGDGGSSSDDDERPRLGFYDETCPEVEDIVASVVRANVLLNPAIAPGILLMHFHDCFVRGCDGSILIAGENTERTAGPNRALRGFNVIDTAKLLLEAVCPRTVSCADILTLAAREAVLATPVLIVPWQVPLGRLDGRISQASDVILPGPNDSIEKLKQDFAAKNLTAYDLVTLVAAHTIGTASCGLVRDRFYNFNGTGKPDPLIAPGFVPLVQARCPQNGDPTARIDLDTNSADLFDRLYLRKVRQRSVVLQSDLLLYRDPETRDIIDRYITINDGNVFHFPDEFAKSMVKMSLIEVKTGSDGEIRRVCSAIN